MATREDYIYYARLAEQAERYEDMIKYMKNVSAVSSCLKYDDSSLAGLKSGLKLSHLLISRRKRP